MTTPFLPEKHNKIIWRHIDPKSNFIVDRKKIVNSIIFKLKI